MTTLRCFISTWLLGRFYHRYRVREHLGCMLADPRAAAAFISFSGLYWGKIVSAPTKRHINTLPGAADRMETLGRSPPSGACDGRTGSRGLSICVFIYSFMHSLLDWLCIQLPSDCLASDAYFLPNENICSAPSCQMILSDFTRSSCVFLLQSKTKGTCAENFETSGTAARPRIEPLNRGISGGEGNSWLCHFEDAYW